jgi:hypothetical protein
LYIILNLILKIPIIGGVDFLYYTLVGRDLSNGTPVGDMRYGYFTGVYLFWKNVFDVFGARILVAQITYVFVLILSSLFCILSMYLLSMRKHIALLAGIIYLLLTYQLEGLFGVTEPISTLFALLAICLYLYFFRTARYRAAIVSVIFFIGLCFFQKQQGVFFVAASFFLPYEKIRKVTQWNVWNFAVPVLSGLFVLFLLVLEAKGIKPIEIVIKFALNYEKEGTFFSNLTLFWSRISPIVLPVVYFSFPFLLISYRPWKKVSNITDPAKIRISIFLAVSALLALYQFRVRGYLHYGLYCVPGITLLLGLFISKSEDVFFSLKKRQQFITSALAFTFFVFALTSSKSYLNALKNQFVGEIVISPLPADTQRLADVCPKLHSQQVLLLPARINSFHWICNTSSALGYWAYSWLEEKADYYYSLISDSTNTDIFVFNKSYGPYEKMILTRPDWSNLEKNLRENNYIIVYENMAGRLYRKIN